MDECEMAKWKTDGKWKIMEKRLWYVLQYVLNLTLGTYVRAKFLSTKTSQPT